MDVVSEDRQQGDSRQNQPSASPEGAVEPTAAEPAQNEVARLTAERDHLLDRLARLQAEFENSRKRAAKENLEYRDHVVGDTIRQILPIIDNFDLALKADTPPESLRQGVELIRRQMEELLKSFGVQRIEAVGKPFDPHHHDAIDIVESPEHPDNHVLQELRSGYKHKEKLLRPAMVRVSKK